MIQFFSDIFLPSMTFLLYATIVGVLASVAFGVMGTFVVIKRISYIAGAISHCVLGGIGLGMYLSQVQGLTWFSPQIGSVVMAIVSAILIGLFSLYYKEREDTLIGAVWAMGMAIGLVLIYYTPGYTDPMSYLFGSILMVSKTDLFTVILIDFVVLLITVFCFNKFVAICFDQEFARLRGLNTNFYYILLLIVIALTIVMLINVVGIVMIIALLTIPSGIAGIFARTIKGMMISSVFICLFTVLAGLIISYEMDTPSGPVIIIINSFLYFTAVLVSKRRYVR